jgi:hypothetical protein
MSGGSASAALVALLTQHNDDDGLRPACTATWLAEPASANPVLVNAEEKSRAFESKCQAADIFTKALAPQPWAPALEMLSIISDTPLPEGGVDVN